MFTRHGGGSPAAGLCDHIPSCPDRGHQDDAEIDDDLDPDTLSALDEFATRLSSIPDMTQAKDALTLHQLGLFAQLPTSYPWGDVMFSTKPACAPLGIPWPFGAWCLMLLHSVRTRNSGSSAPGSRVWQFPLPSSLHPWPAVMPRSDCSS